MGRGHKAEGVLVALTLCLVIGLPLLRWEQTSGTALGRTLATFTARLDRRVPALMHEYAIPGASIALVQGGRVVWSKAYGYADLAQSKPMTAGTLLMAQSISKSLTAWGVMRLAQEGKIQLDAPVLRYLGRWRFPESEFPAEKVTVRQLLSLSAGLPLGDFSAQLAPGEATPSLQETLSGDHVRLLRRPGAAFSYSNTSYALLELLVEEVTHRDFGAYMEEEVLRPLGMRQSSFSRGNELSANVATGYDLKGRPVPPYIYPYRASGGLFATVEDLARFVCAGLMRPQDSAGRQVLSSASVQQLYTPVVKTHGMFGAVSDGYGLGHFLETLPDGRLAVWHGGQGNGWMTHFHAVPETGDGIVIVTNSQRSWPFFAFVLSDWAKWNGFGSVGMGSIARAEIAVQILVGLLLFAAVCQGWRLVSGLIAGRRRFAPLAPYARLARLWQLGLSAVLLSGLLWSVRQEYLFTDSIFPILSSWLWVSLLALAAVSLASACLPAVPGAGSNRSA